MDRPLTAVRCLLVALGVGLAAELLLDGHALGINVPLAVAALLAALVVVAGGVRRIDPLDAWIPGVALVLAGFVALRDDGPLVALDLAGALGLTAASAPALAGVPVTRRATRAIVDLAARVVAAMLVGAVPLVGRARAELDPLGLAVRQRGRVAPVARAAPAAWLRLGVVEALTILLALDVLFAAFVGLQLTYLFGRADTLPAIGMTYANYARRGFFELLAVVGLVGLLVLGLEAVVAPRTRGYVAALLALLGLTAVVLASSLTRLGLYQEAYGWTELRFYVLAAIVFFAICLVAAVVLALRNRTDRLPHAIAAASITVLLAVNVAGPQATVTERNLERAVVPGVVPAYGETTLDAPYLGSLDADAVPALVAALDGLPEDQRGQLRAALRDLWHRYVAAGDDTWQGWNLARERARNALVGLFGEP